MVYIVAFFFYFVFLKRTHTIDWLMYMRLQKIKRRRRIMKTFCFMISCWCFRSLLVEILLLRRALRTWFPSHQAASTNFFTLERRFVRYFWWESIFERYYTREETVTWTVITWSSHRRTCSTIDTPYAFPTFNKVLGGLSRNLAILQKYHQKSFSKVITNTQ